MVYPTVNRTGRGTGARKTGTALLGWLIAGGLLAGTPAIAHQVQLADDVGGTKHIEPNDTPRAGESTLVWFALTRRGGQIIPLDECNCRLSVYTQPKAAGDRPVQEPPLRAITAEGYNGIPAADVTFPRVGAYELVLTGSPRAGDSFKPFQLTFTTTVATGRRASPAPEASPVEETVATPVLPPSPTGTSEQPPTAPASSGAIAGTIGVLGGSYLVWRSYRKHKR